MADKIMSQGAIKAILLLPDSRVLQKPYFLKMPEM